MRTRISPVSRDDTSISLLCGPSAHCRTRCAPRRRSSATASGLPAMAGRRTTSPSSACRSAPVPIHWNNEAELRAFGKRSGDGDEWLRVGALKVYVDGGFTGPSAYTLAPYKGMPGFRGTLNRSPDELYQIVKTAHAMGWQMG